MRSPVPAKGHLARRPLRPHPPSAAYMRKGSSKPLQEFPGASHRLLSLASANADRPLPRCAKRTPG